MFTITTITLAAALAQTPAQPAAQQPASAPATTGASEAAPAPATQDPNLPAEPPAPIAYEPPALSPQAPPVPPELAQLMKDVRWQWNLVRKQLRVIFPPGESLFARLQQRHDLSAGWWFGVGFAVIVVF